MSEDQLLDELSRTLCITLIAVDAMLPRNAVLWLTTSMYIAQLYLVCIDMHALNLGTGLFLLAMRARYYRLPPVPLATSAGIALLAVGLWWINVSHAGIWGEDLAWLVPAHQLYAVVAAVAFGCAWFRQRSFTWARLFRCVAAVGVLLYMTGVNLQFI